MKNFTILALFAGLTVLAFHLDAQGLHGLPDTLSSSYPAAHNTHSLRDFPKLHPLIVHIPIMCLIMAFLVQAASFFAYREAFSWITLVLVVLGFAGAYLSGGIFHGGDPNLAALDPVTRATFETHERFADYTVWISGIALLLKLLSHFAFRRRTSSELLVLLALTACSYTVSVTGDMGARLVHIDGIGVQGRGLPLHDNM